MYLEPMVDEAVISDNFGEVVSSRLLKSCLIKTSDKTARNSSLQTNMARKILSFCSSFLLFFLNSNVGAPKCAMHCKLEKRAR